MRNILLALLLGLLISPLSHGAAPIAAARISVHFNDTQLGIQLEGAAHLSDLLTHPDLPQGIYWPAALISTPQSDRETEQSRQRLLAELATLEHGWAAEGKAGLAQSARLLARQVATLKLAGRLPVRLDPDWVRIRPQSDPPLEGDYQLFLSSRKSKLNVFGLISGKQRQELVPGQAGWGYLAARRLMPGADKDYAFLVQPTGTIARIPVAYWNRLPREPAPGATLFVGFDESRLPKKLHALNQRLATLLANRIPE